MYSSREKIRICPYNNSHLIFASRFLKHLNKCELQHPHIQLETCPYNLTHRVTAEEFEAHKARCWLKEMKENPEMAEHLMYDGLGHGH